MIDAVTPLSIRQIAVSRPATSLLELMSSGLDPLTHKWASCALECPLLTVPSKCNVVYQGGLDATIVQVCDLYGDYFYLVMCLIALLYLLIIYFLYLFFTSRIPSWHSINSYFLQNILSMTKQPKTSHVIRSTFNSMHHVSNRLAGAHTHPASAADRSSASSFMSHFAAILGLDLYYYQQSPSDQRNKRLGERDFYWAKDLNAEYQPPSVNPDMVAIVDVDYYMDMNAFLSKHSCPVILYTLVPSGVCKNDGEFSYTFEKDNTIRYEVSGGATYRHPLWSYNSDVIVASTTRFGFLHTETVYNVDRRQMDGDHQIICLTPMKRYIFPFLRLSSFVDCSYLQRLVVVEPTMLPNGQVENFTRLDFQTSSGRMRATGKCGTYAQAIIPADVDDTIAIQASLSKVDLTVAQVKVLTGSDDAVSSTVLTQYHRFGTPEKNDVAYPISHAFSTFNFSPKTHDPEAKPCMTAFMAPLALGTYIPNVSEANDTQAIVGRIEQVRPKDVPLTPMLVGYMQEFVELFIPNPHLGHPTDEEEVRARQPRPTQQKILDEASMIGGLSNKPPKSFMKREPYAKVTDPRNITTIPPANKLKYSTYIYSFSDHLRTMCWYAFGKNPLEIAQRVAQICSKAESVSMTDLARCDGRIGNRFRELEKMFMLRFFSKTYHEDLTLTMQTQFQQRAVTSTGRKYDTGFSRLSGSPETADFNSVDNCFMAYVTYRRMNLTSSESWARLGIYGGDDGLSPDINAKLYADTALEMGQVLEEETAKRNHPGVNFLARWYSPTVWGGDLNSMCDLRRQIIKLHVTVNLPNNITPIAKLREKLRGYKAMDNNTPVFKQIIQAVEITTGKLSEEELIPEISNYYSKYEPSVQYPNEDVGGWMFDEFARNFPSFDFSKFLRWSEQVSAGRANVLEPPLFSEELPKLKPPADVVVDGDIVRASVATAVCPHYMKGQCSFGPKCKLSHPGNIPQTEARCQSFYKNNKCEFGDKCKFKHISPPAGKPGAKLSRAGSPK